MFGILSAASLTVVASCSESTAPRPLAVTVSAKAVRPPDFINGDRGQPIIACTVELEARASGTGGAFWDEATYYFYFGTDHSEPADSGKITPAEIAQGWDSERIEAGQRWPSVWTFSGSAPFSVRMVFGYKPDGGGERRTASTSFDCGPTIPANAPRPVITTLVVSPQTEIMPGQELRVSYTLASEVGLWESVVEVSGACDTVVVQAHWLAHSVSNTESIILPATCTLDQPLSVVVHAVDAAVQVTSQQVSLTVADRAPPTIQVQLAADFGPPLNGPVAGELFGGEPLKLVISATDNLGLQKLFWEIVGSGTIDSATVSGAAVSRATTIVAPTALNGTMQIRAWARDVAGHLSPVYESAIGAIRVYPTVARPVHSAFLSGSIDDFVIDSKRNVLYIRQSRDSRIAVFSLATGTVTQTITTFGPPLDMDLSVSGDSLIFTTDAKWSLSILDLQSASPVITSVPLTALDVSTWQLPGELRIASNGRAIVLVSGTAADSKRVLEVDLATGAQRFLTPGESPTTGAGTIERSHDRTKLLIAGFMSGTQIFDVAADRFGPTRVIWGTQWRHSVDATGSVIASGLRLYDESLLSLRTAQTIGGRTSLTSAISPDGQHLYSMNSAHGIIRSRVSDGAILDRFEIGMDPAIIRVSADGSLLVYATVMISSSQPIRIGWTDPR